LSHAAHEIEPNLNVGCAELLLTNANTSVMLLADRPQRASCRPAAVTGRRIRAVA
jgi:hypothetical protein